MASNNNTTDNRSLPPQAANPDTPSPTVNNHANAGIEPKSLAQTPRTSAQLPTKTSAGTSSGQQSLVVSRSPSAAASPWSSRDSSPAPSRKQSSAAAVTRGMRSRKNSHDVSPSRAAQPAPISTVPSAAAIQRALSAAAIPQLQPTPTTTADQSSRIPRSQKSNGSSMEGIPHWPVSPRLKSPPPSSGSRRKSRSSQKKVDLAPSIVVQGSTPSSSAEQLPILPDEEQKPAEKPINLPAKPPGRGASGAPKLATVQEASLPTTPGSSFNPGRNGSDSKPFSILSDDDQRSLLSPEKPPRPTSRPSRGAESGSDSGGRSRDRKRDRGADLDATPRATRSIASRSSQSSLRPKANAETATKNMTVTTETVDSVAQAALNPPDRSASGRAEPGGTLKVKGSNETIRPKKERKKTSRKVPSVSAGTASSRADIFEGQVLDAMDQATSDDSDETFVYESNPPESEPHRSRGRHHSRTPSATSMASLADQRPGLRSIAGVLDPQRPMQKSRSMKFASNAYGPGVDDDVERQDGTVRASRNGGSSILHHHHPAGRHSRTSTGPTSILDDENPTFPALNKARSLTGIASRQSQNGRNGPAANKRENGYSSYDLDDEPADDERTPLIGNGRNPRGGIRTPRSTRQRFPDVYPRHRRSLLSRFAGCIVLFVMLLLLAFGVVAFLFAISKPLGDVRIIEIDHVLASEQEIMLDLVVEAINPNLLPINVAEMDVNIFAKSKYVGSEKWWREHPSLPASAKSLKLPEREPWRQADREFEMENGITVDKIHTFDDDQSDPPKDPPKDGDSTGNKQTMLLGHVHKFDNPLSFDGSFWRQHPHYSTGSLRLNQPGNKTELGGTERWERVLQHPFNLLVRGVLKYTIPLGGSRFSAPINAEILVHPEKGIDKDADNVDPIGRVKSVPSEPSPGRSPGASTLYRRSSLKDRRETAVLQ